MQPNARTIKAARALNARYANPEVAAHNRFCAAKSERARAFWVGVVHVLFRPYSGMCWTDEEINNWRLIRGEVA